MLSNFAILDIGTPELIIILGIILLLFGGKKLPEITKNLGQSVQELRRSFNGSDSSEKTTTTKKSDK